MSNSPFLCLVWALTDPPPGLPGVGGGPIDPGFGNWGGVGGPHPGGGPIFHPGHPDHGLPSQPGHPGNRPPGSGGGPVDPGFGQGGRPHPGNRPPGSGGGHPGNALPPGEEVEIDNELPPVPPEYEDKVIIAIKKPEEEWRFIAYEAGEIDNSLPPAPEPHQ